MRLHFDQALGTLLSLFGLTTVLTAVTLIAASRPTWHPRAVKPAGLSALESVEDDKFNMFLETLTRSSVIASEIPAQPPVDPAAPRPADSRLYNNLLENLLSSLHFYYRVSEDAPPSQFVTSWVPETGYRTTAEARLLALEHNTNYLLALEIYKRLHTKAVFDEDLEYARKRLEALFAEEWHTQQEWPLGVYFDLVRLNQVTGDPRYLQWAERYAAGDGPQDGNTPLAKALSLAGRFQARMPLIASPLHFLHAALLADWGKRRDPGMVSKAGVLFDGLKELLLDHRYNLLWKQVSVTGRGTTNYLQTFDTLEQLVAIRACLMYHEASGDQEALSLARLLIDGVWGPQSPFLVKSPEEPSSNTFFGLYTAYDVERESERWEPGESALVQILLFHANIDLNRATTGAYRADIDFLSKWLEDAGPVYQSIYNGYMDSYGRQWSIPEDAMISPKAAIWMARALAEDELYRFNRAREIAATGIE